MQNNRVALLFISALFLPACSSSPPVSFYTLTLDAPERSEIAVQTPFPHSIAIGPVDIPEAVNRSQLVVRVGPNRVAVLEAEHWAEPLKNGISQLVAACLRRDLEGASVAPLALSRSGAAEFSVSLDVQRFESLPDEAAVIDVVWAIKRRGADSEPITVTTHLREAVQGAGYEALVAAHSRALATLSRAIAAALVTSQQDAPAPR